MNFESRAGEITMRDVFKVNLLFWQYVDVSEEPPPQKKKNPSNITAVLSFSLVDGMRKTSDFRSI